MTERAISAIRLGKPVVIPTDTVYGLVTTPLRSEPVERLYDLKGRGPLQPTALMAPDETIGVRVPELPEVAAEILRSVGALAATSANLAGGPDPATLEDMPPAIRNGCAVFIDGGRLPGVPSTVVDCTGDDPQILREGAVPAADVLDGIRTAVS